MKCPIPSCEGKIKAIPLRDMIYEFNCDRCKCSIHTGSWDNQDELLEVLESEDPNDN